MLKIIKTTLAAFVFCSATFASAEQLTIKSDAPKSYTVKQGDTLWDISGMYLEKPWLWPSLWKMNPQVANPHLIYPGDVLHLTYDADGKPVLSVSNQTVAKLSPDTSGSAMANGEVRGGDVRKLSPEARKTLKSSKAITTLPLQMIRPFLTYEQALTEEQINGLPYVLGADEQVKNVSSGHILYVRGKVDQGAAYGVYRKGKQYVDPASGEVLGYETKLVGTARVFRTGNPDQNEPGSLKVVDVKQEIRQGDRLLPAADGQSLPAFFSMRKPEQPIAGVIIDTTSNLREFSTWDIVVLNKGAQDNVKAGYMFGIYRRSPAVVDTASGPVYTSDATLYQQVTGGHDGEPIQMPEEKIGDLMVFKVAERTSFAIVTGTRKPIRVGDTIGEL
ncbi:MAG TPA: peptidoglycan-binding protein [Rheinheimera sp.]|nr:peptidoglycan-binding protein [Rheinheimera sp.]